MRNKKDFGIHRLFDSLSDLMFPPVCIICGRHRLVGEKGVCHSCVSGIRVIDHPLCPRCGRPFDTIGDADRLCGRCMVAKPPFDVARSYGVYGGPLLEAIHLFKYRHRTYLAPVISGLIIGREWNGFLEGGVDLIVPVPLHKRRLYERGFNQSLLLCRDIGRGLKIPMNTDGLKRIRWTAPQIQLSPEKREHNVRGAFWADKEVFAGKRVLLIDDVYTTGATVSECAHVLKRVDACWVGVLTAARVVIT